MSPEHQIAERERESWGGRETKTETERDTLTMLKGFVFGSAFSRSLWILVIFLLCFNLDIEITLMFNQPKLCASRL